MRLLWTERLLTGTAEVSCPEPDAPCILTPTAEETLHPLSISTSTADGFDSAVLVDRDFTVEDADIDGTGKLHLVGSTREATGSRIDYLLLGP